MSENLEQRHPVKIKYHIKNPDMTTQCVNHLIVLFVTIIGTFDRDVILLIY